MGDVRVSQVVVESLSTQDPAPGIRVSQAVVQTLSTQDPSPEVRASQVVVQTLSLNLSPVLLTPSAGPLALGGLAPAIIIPQVVNPASVTLLFAGPAAIASLDISIGPNKASATLSGLAPDVTNTGVPRPSVGTLSVTGVTPSAVIAANAFLTPATTTLALSGLAARLFMPAGNDFAALLLY